MEKSVLVIGGGIAGLTVAYRLKQDGFEVTLLEQNSRLGGAIHSEIVDGFLTETGPNTILETSPLVTELVRDLDLEDAKVYANEESKIRYIARDKTPVPLPLSPLAFIASPLFSWRAKLRLLKEPFIAAWDNSYEESLAQFVLRRLGQEFLDYAINPFVAGVYAGRPQALSVQHGFPKLYTLEQRYGSLIKGQILGARERRRREETSKQRARMFSFAGGLKTLTDALEKALGAAVRTEVSVTDISATEGGWEVTGRSGGKETVWSASSLVYTGQAYGLGRITFNQNTAPDLVSFEKIYYPPVSVLYLGFRREDVEHPLDGFGLLIPEVERFHTLGVLFSSTLFRGRAPEGQVLLTIFIGGARNPEKALRPEAELVEMALEDYRVLLGVGGKPSFIKSITWNQAIPQYEVGYGIWKDQLEELETRYPGLFFAGCYRNGISVADTIVNAQETAGRIESYCS